MKKFLFIALVACSLFSSCGQKGEEQSKTISDSTVKYSGMHSDLLRVKGDVKIILTKCSPDGDKWCIKAVVPFENVKKWSEVPDTDESLDTYYKASMGNISLGFIDADGSEMSHSLTPDYGVVESLLSSESIKSETMTVQVWGGFDSYEEALEVYNKIQGMTVKNMELSKVYSSGGSSYSSSSDDDDDYDDEDLDKAIDDYNKVLDATKKTVEAYEDLYDALD